jgi:hypothetical protein
MNGRPQTSLSLSPAEIEAFAGEWYRKLDQHAPAAEVVPMLAERDLAFQLPEGVLSSRDDFGDWYAGGRRFPGVINLFFDELHTLESVEVLSADGDRARVRVVVNWQARRWRPPHPRSEWIGFDAFQDWEMVRSAETGRPVIVRYVVDELRPMPGSPAL